jgi:hypothetical protein
LGEQGKAGNLARKEGGSKPVVEGGRKGKKRERKQIVLLRVTDELLG